MTNNQTMHTPTTNNKLFTLHNKIISTLLLLRRRGLDGGLTILLLFLSLLTGAQTIVHTGGVVYVTPTGGGNGNSWSAPTNNLQAAINASGVTTVLVAVGSYDVPVIGLRMKSGVAIYGGFDPGAGITDLTHNRILPNYGTPEGSVLNGAYSERVIRNKYSESEPMLNASSAILDGFTIANGVNNAEGGGGIYNAYASAVFRNLVIKDNKAEYEGAGVLNVSCSPEFTNVIIKDNELTIPTGTCRGGGMSNNNASPKLTNVAITGNKCSSGNPTTNYGAGMNNNHSYPVLINVTIADNIRATFGGGMYNSNSSQPEIYNSIFWGNRRSGLTTSIGADIESDNSAVILKNSITQGYSTGSGADNNKENINPQFAAGAYTLSATSPAINMGNNAFFNGLDETTKDLAGNNRVYTFFGGGNIDMGAYEAPYNIAIVHTGGTVYVKPVPTGKQDGSSWANATADLQAAIDASGVHNVFVAIGNYNIPSSAGFKMKNGVEIYGGFDPANGITDLTHNRILPNQLPSSGEVGEGSEGSILNGRNTGKVINNNYTSGNELTNSAILNGFTIMNGNSSDNGGGIYNTFASPILTNLAIKNNRAVNDGGGVYNYRCSPQLNRCIISNNTISGGAGRGGGVSNWEASPRIINVLIADNTAGSSTMNSTGGGIYNTGATSKPEFINVTIAGNRVTAPISYGAGMYNNGSSPEVYNSIFWDNKGNGNTIVGDADIYNNGSVTLTLKNSITQAYGNGDNLKVNQNPQFVNAAGDYYTLLATSPAINAGNNSFYSGLNANTTDLTGNKRVYKFAEGGTIDMGAYEFPPAFAPANGIIYVKPVATGTGSGDSWANATGDLHNAIKAPGVQKVFVAIGTYPVGAHSFEMKNGVEIYGGFDPANNITDLTHNRIMPNPANTQGSVLDGQNLRPVIWNVFTAGAELNNTAVLDGFTVAKGSFSSGAGLRNIYASPTLRNVVIRNNAATASGAGIYNENSSPLLTNVVISSNDITNTGTGVTISGAGIYNSNTSNPVITNATITRNTLFATLGTMKGAGIYNNNSSPRIYNSIIWNNQKMTNPAIEGADIEKEGTGTITLKNSMTQRYVTGNPADSNKTDAPLFVNENTGNYTLTGVSPAINAGSNSYYSGLSTSKDLSGNPRLSGTAIDMGAYEFPIALTPDNGIIYVRTTATGNRSGNNWNNATDDLHNAIHTNGVQKVFVATGTYPVGDHSFIMKNGVEIYGGFDPNNGITDLSHNRIMPTSSGGGSALNGQNIRPVIWNIFPADSALNNSAVLDGFTITAGSYINGAGIRNIYASPTLRNLVVRGNNATTSGAGIYNNNSSPLISNTVISDNTATNTISNVYGAGMYNTVNAAPVITNTTITGNKLVITATGSMNGAGIFNDGGATPKIYNSIIWNNQKNNNATASGADIENIGATLTLKNSITQLYTTGNVTDSNKVNADPSFTDAATGNYTLKNTSPAINAGNNSWFAGLNGDTKDLAGNPRVYGAGIIDMGAYESPYYSPTAPDVNGIVYVRQDAFGTGSGSSWDNATSDLQGAIDATGTQKVYVAVGNYDVGTSSFVMKNNVEIYGGFNPVGNTTDWSTRTLPTETITGSVLNGLNTRPLIYNNNNGLTATSILDGFTLMNGKGNNGGAIYNLSVSPTFNNLVIRNNEASTSGGAIYNLNAPIKMSNAIIKNNTALYGGAIRNNSSNSVFTNVSITHNTATMATTGAGGGGIFNELSNLVLTNVLIADNVTGFQGGGFRNLSGNPVLTNVTIAGNTAGSSTAINLSADTMQIDNSIIYGTIAGSGTYTAQHSLIEADAGGTNGNIDGTAITAVQVFADVANHNYTLRNSAPVIDAGSNALYTGLDNNTKDLAGNPRLSNAVIDMGAYEFPIVLTPDANKIIYVKPVATGDKDGSSWVNATSDLHNAIHAGDVEKVFVAIGNYLVGDNSFVMKNGVEIYGSFDPANNITDLTHNRILPNHGVAEGSVLDGQNVRPVIWNAFSSSTPLNNTAVLDGFTITHGKAASGYTEGNYNGGGMYNYYASPTLRNLAIRDNYSANAGGGIANEQSSAPIMTNVLIAGNSSGNVAGGLYNYNAGNLTLTNVAIVGNTSSSTGRGIYNSNTYLTLINVTIAGHTDPAIYHGSGALTLKNSIVWGAIANGSYTAQNSLIQGNNSTANGNIDASTAQLNKLFTDPANGDYTLRPGSLAIDAGNNTLFSGLDAYTKDLAGNARVFDFVGNGVIDLGAYESPYPGLAPDAGNIIYVKETYSGNGSGSSWANATDNLHNAIHTKGVQKVFVATGNYNVGSSSFIMKNGVEMYGGFDPNNGITDLTHNRVMPPSGVAGGGSVLNGQNTRPVIWNVFTSTKAINNTAVLDGFTVMNGNYDRGAGIRNVYASPILRNVVIRDNNATSTTPAGAGIYNENSSPLIINSVIHNNMVQQPANNTQVYLYGGGMFNTSGSSPTVVNSTITGNKLQGTSPSPFIVFEGAGIYNISNSSVTIYNSIIWNNQIIGYSGGTEDIKGETITVKNSITQTYNSGNTADNIKVGVAPMFVSATDFSLQNGSPAVNTGVNALYAGLDANTKDLAGNPRVHKFTTGGIIDLGAYESTYTGAVMPDTNGIVYVREGFAGNGKSWTYATGDLQEAIEATGVQKVFVATGNYDAPASTGFVMKNNVAIYGSFDPDNGIQTLNDARQLPTSGWAGEAGSVLNGQNTHSVIVNRFTSATALNNTAILDGFTIANGKTDTSGGGIYNAYASPVLTNLVIKSNSAKYGGGIYNYFSNPVMTNTIIHGNTAILDASTSYGGGIANVNSNPTLTNTIIHGNTAAYYGGGIANFNASPVLTNVTIARNKVSNPAGRGSGMYGNASSPTVYNSILWENDINGNTGIPGADIDRTGSGTLTLKNSMTQSYTTGNPIDNNLTGIDPLFTDAANGDYELTYRSRAINAGNNALYAGLDEQTKDLAGNARVFEFTNGGIIDLGAYESLFNTPITPDINSIVYVKPTATGTGSGNTWENATGDLQGAIEGTDVQKVFVAKGNYNVPVVGEGFVMKNGIEIYGGFDPDKGIRTLNDTRILPNQHPFFGGAGDTGSILNGEHQKRVIDNNFTSATALDSTAILDGFTIKNGFIGEGGHAAGIKNVYASPTLRNLVIKDNEAYGGNGGGVFNDYYSSPAITNVIITGNEAKKGNGIYNDNGSSPVLTNVLITGNTSDDNDYEIHDLSGNSIYTNVTIAGDIYASATTSWNNAILIGTFDRPNGMGYSAKYSLIQGDAGGSNGNLNGTAITPADVFTDPANGDYTLKSTSPAMNTGSNALFAGLNADTKDLAGNPRVYNFANGGVIDLGAYEAGLCATVYTTDTRSECAPYTWIDGNQYTSDNNTATFTLPAAYGCDSIITLNLTIRNGTYNTESQTVCERFVWNGTTYTTSGVYTYNYTNANGCPSTDTLHLTVNKGTQNTENETACESFLWNGITYTTSGVYTYNYTNANGCPSTDTLHLTVNKGTHNTESQTACESFLWNGITYTTSGVYTYNYTNVNGCPSTDTLHLTVNKGTHNTENYTTCESFAWHGATYTTSGTYTYSYTNANGCPSTDTLHVTINNGINNVEHRTACESFVWNGTTYTTSGTYIYTNTNGCPGTDTLHLTINKGTHNTETQTACESFVWNGIAYASSGTYTYDYTNATGCPSVDTLHLTINKGTHNTESQTACESFVWNGMTYTASGTHTYSYTNANGCPSTDTLHLTVNYGTYNSETQAASDSFMWNGTTYKESGIYTYDYTNIQGCPSTDTLHLTIQGGALPVRLLSFTVQKQGQTALLQWTTASEQNNKGFDIEHSTDAKNWSPIAFLFSLAKNGNNSGLLNYTYMHNTPVQGKNFYRLKQTDYEDRYEYSFVRILSFDGKSNIGIYPNPANEQVTLTGLTGNETISIYDIAGRKLKQVKSNNTDMTISLGNLNTGVYQVHIIATDGTTVTFKLVKTD